MNDASYALASRQGLGTTLNPARENTIADYVGETATILADIGSMLDAALHGAAKGDSACAPVPSSPLNRLRDLALANRNSAGDIRTLVERLVSELR